MTTFAEAVERELAYARKKHLAPINSAHEGVAVIKEEFLEFRALAYLKDHERARMWEGLVHTAAMCQRTAEDCLAPHHFQQGGMMEKITDDQIKKALELHKVEGRILRTLKSLEDPERRFRVLMSAGLLTGMDLSQLAGWLAAGTSTASETRASGK